MGVASFNSFDSVNGKVLYAVPSLVNHSCMPSAHKAFFGSLFALRAIRDIKEGEEVTIAYIPSYTPYDEKRIRLMNSWRFNCSCGVCQADEEDGFEARETRRSLSRTMDNIGAKINTTFDLGTVRRLAADVKKACDGLRETYNKIHSDKAEGLKYELAQPLRLYATVVQRLGQASHDQSFIKQAIELKMESLTVSGVRVTDRTLSGALPKGIPGKKPPLPVDTSRISETYDISVITALEIANLFRELGDKPRARRWFDVAVWSALSPNSAQNFCLLISYSCNSG